MAGCGRLDALGAEQVLHANGNAGHFAKRLARGPVGIDRLRRLNCLFGCFHDEGVKRFCFGNIGIEGCGNFDGGKCAGGYAIADSGHAQFGKFGHLTTPSP